MTTKLLALLIAAAGFAIAQTTTTPTTTSGGMMMPRLDGTAPTTGTAPTVGLHRIRDAAGAIAPGAIDPTKVQRPPLDLSKLPDSIKTLLTQLQAARAQIETLRADFKVKIDAATTQAEKDLLIAALRAAEKLIRDSNADAAKQVREAMKALRDSARTSTGG